VKKKLFHNVNRTITVLAGTVIVLFFSCQNNYRAKNLFIRTTETVPSGQTENFTAYYTLRGEIAMIMQAPLMEDYGNYPEFARQTFPRGLQISLNGKNRKDTTRIKSDSAVIYKRTGLVELIGNVKITGPDGSSLLTHRLFWDRMHDHIFTDENIEFRRRDEFIRGKGFDSNINFTNARVNNVTGIFKVKPAR
jgi:LPS export ABC transporter protein LptC